MLTISKPLSAGQAQTYHAKEFTAPEQNYWRQGCEVQGEWHGRLAAAYGLDDAVSAKDFGQLSEGRHPQTGEQLVCHRKVQEYQSESGKTVAPVEHRAGWDATFSAPKSVSLTALVGGDDRVRQAHREAVNVALDELERYTQARIGGNHAAQTTGRFMPQSSSTIPLGPLMAMPLLNCTHMRSFLTSRRWTMGPRERCNREHCLTHSNSRQQSINLS